MIWFVTLIILLTASTLVLGDDDEHEDHDRRSFRDRKYAPAPVQLISKEAYAAHCSSCHMPYPPELLPVHSWATLIGKITNNTMHFGIKAPLTQQERSGVVTYLVAQSASISTKAIAFKVMRSLRYGQTPLRITDTPYFIKRTNTSLNR